MLGEGIIFPISRPGETNLKSNKKKESSNLRKKSKLSEVRLKSQQENTGLHQNFSTFMLLFVVY